MIALFFDTETTGFKSAEFTPEIVQIAAILQDTDNMQELAKISLIVEPHGVIPEHAAEIHGITTEFARSFGVPKLQAQAVFTTLLQRCDMLVAHNIEFDLQMLECDWQAAWYFAIEKLHYCTMRSTLPILKLPKKKNGNAFHNSLDSNYKAPKLVEAHQYFFGTPIEGAHNALVDAEACRNIYFATRDLERSGGK